MAASPRRVLESQLCDGGGGLPLAETRRCSVLVVAGIILDFPSSLNLLIAVFVPFQSYYWIPRRRTRVLYKKFLLEKTRQLRKGKVWQMVSVPLQRCAVCSRVAVGS